MRILQLNCTRCGEFTDYWEEKKHMVKCDECGKRHHTDSIWMVDPSKSYERDEAGNLLEAPI